MKYTRSYGWTHPLGGQEYTSSPIWKTCSLCGRDCMGEDMLEKHMAEKHPQLELPLCHRCGGTGRQKERQWHPEGKFIDLTTPCTVCRGQR